MVKVYLVVYSTATVHVCRALVSGGLLRPILRIEASCRLPNLTGYPNLARTTVPRSPPTCCLASKGADFLAPGTNCNGEHAVITMSEKAANS